MRTPGTAEFTTLPLENHEVPTAFPSPFDELGPHPIAALAADQLQRSLRSDDQAEGKVFGVLVVKNDADQFGFLKAFSGKWAGQWCVDGFSPPLFELADRARLDAASDAVIKPLHDRVEALKAAPALRDARQALDQVVRDQAVAQAVLASRHAVNRAHRATLRAAGPTPEADQLSRNDSTEKKELARAQALALNAAKRQARVAERKVLAGQRLLSFVSAKMVRQIIELPMVPNALGARRPIASFFETVPPGGAGECAAPKLLARAYALGLRPIALAEFWWGPTQATGRVRGAHVPACKAKCGPLLPYMLEGLDVSAPRRVVTRVSKATPLRIVFEDAQLRVIEKPEGLLSVSGRESTHIDAVETRMPDAKVVHRLDLDTSGLLVMAKDQPTYVALQQQFARRHIDKRYIAIVEGLISDARGTISLPLRADVTDRPRQMYDPVHGKEALTKWQVISRTGQRTRLVLTPLTGRTHQLRVHCAHALGLRAPIVGDRLYGGPAERLLLHCEFLALTHPVTEQRLTFEAAAPF